MIIVCPVCNCVPPSFNRKTTVLGKETVVTCSYHHPKWVKNKAVEIITQLKKTLQSIGEYVENFAEKTIPEIKEYVITVLSKIKKGASKMLDKKAWVKIEHLQLILDID